MTGSSVRALALAACLSAASLPLAAQGLFETDVIDVEVLPGWRDRGMEHIAALRLTLDPGWKTYWRAPGDAGIPPLFDWTGSQNVAAIRPHWPVPSIFNQNGMRSIGYEREVVIPLHITRRDASRPILLSAQVSLGVCEEICIPAHVYFEAELPAEGGPDRAISRALADRPMTAREAGVEAVTCAIEPIEDGLGLTVEITMPKMPGAEEAVVETADPTVWVAEPTLTRQGNHLTAETDLVRYNAEPFALDRSGIRVTVFGAGNAVDIRGCSAG